MFMFRIVEGIQTVDVLYWRQPCCQLSHHHHCLSVSNFWFIFGSCCFLSSGPPEKRRDATIRSRDGDCKVQKVVSDGKHVGTNFLLEICSDEENDDFFWRPWECFVHFWQQRWRMRTTKGSFRDLRCLFLELKSQKLRSRIFEEDQDWKKAAGKRETGPDLIKIGMKGSKFNNGRDTEKLLREE